MKALPFLCLLVEIAVLTACAPAASLPPDHPSSAPTSSASSAPSSCGPGSSSEPDPAQSFVPFLEEQADLTGLLTGFGVDIPLELANHNLTLHRYDQSRRTLYLSTGFSHQGQSGFGLFALDLQQKQAVLLHKEKHPFSPVIGEEAFWITDNLRLFSVYSLEDGSQLDEVTLEEYYQPSGTIQDAFLTSDLSHLIVQEKVPPSGPRTSLLSIDLSQGTVTTLSHNLSREQGVWEAAPGLLAFREFCTNVSSGKSLVVLTGFAGEDRVSLEYFDQPSIQPVLNGQGILLFDPDCPPPNLLFYDFSSRSAVSMDFTRGLLEDVPGDGEHWADQILGRKAQVTGEVFLAYDPGKQISLAVLDLHPLVGVCGFGDNWFTCLRTNEEKSALIWERYRWKP